MKIYSVNDKEFAAYGKVHTGYDVSDLLSALDKSTPLPDAVGYVPSEAALENTKLFGLLQNNAYGGMPIQLGWCRSIFSAACPANWAGATVTTQSSTALSITVTASST